MRETTFWLRLEGLVVFVLAILVYGIAGASWWWFVAGLLLPDISMLGYLANDKSGAMGYNIGHSLVLPLLVIGFGYLYVSGGALSVGLVWLAHIGMDRMLGYGLKDNKGFKHTHLGKIGR